MGKSSHPLRKHEHLSVCQSHVVCGPLIPAGVDGRFWYVNSAGLVCSDGEAPEDFSLELLEHGRLAIRGKNGKYLRGDQGGTLKGDGLTLNNSSLWEY